MVVGSFFVGGAKVDGKSPLERAPTLRGEDIAWKCPDKQQFYSAVDWHTTPGRQRWQETGNSTPLSPAHFGPPAAAKAGSSLRLSPSVTGATGEHGSRQPTVTDRSESEGWWRKTTPGGGRFYASVRRARAASLPFRALRRSTKDT